jgi:2-haloacid dehalogenase
MKPKAFVFDAYGTLFDVHSVVLRGSNNIPGDLNALSTLWRQTQLEYTWLRSLMEHYEDFWDVTKAALRSAVTQLKIEASAAQLDSLMQAYLVPSVFPDATDFGCIERSSVGHLVERFAQYACVGGLPQWSGTLFR